MGGELDNHVPRSSLLLRMTLLRMSLECRQNKTVSPLIQFRSPRCGQLWGPLKELFASDFGCLIPQIDIFSDVR